MRCSRRAIRSSAISVAAALVAAACRGEPSLPPASFLAVAGDSSFWIEASPQGWVTRRSALMLARLDGRFHELYVADEDLSYRDALMLGQRVFRRDLASGDSALVRYDSSIVKVAVTWAARNPGDRPLAPDEETVEDPAVQATTDTELLDIVGPYLSYEFHLDVDVQGARDQHVTQRGVVDIRDGHAVGLRDLMPEDAARRTWAEGRRRLAATLDSIQRARDERATRARATLAGLAFDSTSFELVSSEAGPAVAFLVPGRGARAGGYSLALGEIPIAPGPWWSALSPTLASRSGEDGAVWADTSYDVVASVAAGGAGANITVRRGGRQWVAANLPLPVRRIFRLGTSPADSLQRRALARAFDEADSFGGLTRPASLRQPRSRPPVTRLQRTWKPEHHATAKRSLPTS